MKGRKKLETLKVAIRENGKIVRIHEIPDPRAVYCDQYNKLGMSGVAEPYFAKRRKRAV